MSLSRKSTGNYVIKDEKVGVFLGVAETIVG